MSTPLFQSLKPLVRSADFRSDTVTKPTAFIATAMFAAASDYDAVGDDVYGEDPTIKALETTVAKILGKEAAVFVPTCTMANLLAVGSHCQRGDEVLLGSESHIFVYEQGGASWLMGTVFHGVTNAPDGTLPLDSLRAALATRAAAGTDAHFARPALICIENTANRCGGALLPPSYIDALGTLASQHNLPVHCDGARLFNAATAAQVPVAELVKGCTSVSVCLSKGLGAPLGALLVGPSDFCVKARRLRKAVGGGMRQAGVIAAAGLAALEEQMPLLQYDHLRARKVAQGLGVIKGLIPQEKVDTNIVYVALDSSLTTENWIAKVDRARATGATSVLDIASNVSIPFDAIVNSNVSPGAAFQGLLKSVANVKVGGYGTQKIRVVTHHDVNDNDVEMLIAGAAIVVRLLSV